MTIQTYGSKASAIRGARRAGLDVIALTFVQDGMTWTYAAAAPVAAAESVEPAPVAVEAETPDQMRARLSAETAAWLADEDMTDSQAVAVPGEAELAAPLTYDDRSGDIVQPGTLDAMIDSVAADQAVAAKTVADLTQAEALALFNEEEAMLNPARAYRCSFTIERAADHLALNAAQDYARKLGFSIMVTSPTGTEMVGTPKGKRAKAAIVGGKPRKEPKPAAAKGERAPKATGPNAKTAKMIELALRPEGVTRPQLAAEISDKAQPWTQMLKDAAEKFGYTFSSEREKGGNTVYRLIAAK